MPSLYALTSTTALANLRTDLSDTNAAAYRWPDATLQRCIDRANERYSWVNPWLQMVQTPCVVGSILYAWPASAYYIDKVEYPLGQYPKSFIPFLSRKSPLISAPSASDVAGAAVGFSAGGSVAAATYTYGFTYTTPGGGETTLTQIAGVVNGIAGAKAVLTGIPIGPYGVTGRNIYRSSTGQPTFHLVTSIADNQTITYTDSAADASIAAAATPPNANSTQNLDQLELQLPPEQWPTDTTRLIEITYATKHELDTNGTTIPERHWDCIYYGAAAYAMFAYLPQVNDNFEYADGHLRDRVDDTAIPVNWRVQCETAMRDFEQMLKLIKEEANTSVTGLAHWGDKPLRWEIL